MPFIPHTADDVAQMLASIGVRSIDDLFDEVPAELGFDGLPQLAPGASELELTRLMEERASGDGRWLNFIGAGAYEHHIPAAVWQLAGRGEFYTAYTPYQAEASQGTLQLLYEWQSMMASLTALDVSNASLYDGATALAEALLMAVRALPQAARRVLVPRNLHPFYRATLKTVLHQQAIDVVEIAFDRATGRIDPAALESQGAGGFAALAINQPNFFGVLEDASAVTDWAHGQGALVVGVCNPLAMAVIAPPGEWAEDGADVACGDAQPFGIPLSGGGPYLGYLTCRSALVRQMPGRIVGRTVDLDGRSGFALTLQAREQHIRRSKATSNICTNQGLMVTAATIHLALIGRQGLERVAMQCHSRSRELGALLAQVPGVAPLFDAPVFHETVLRLPLPVPQVLGRMRGEGILGGLDLAPFYPELGHAMLVCTTETRTADDLQRYARALQAALES
ncbi:MAG: aminomethyl-transferring glycine dehydrogenase subunit GcvPA [Betaproteobacteria bacterium]|nr:aminomethyl-transferring glycine dehydrogenase subunit GcvPA [Betaproteobacteria bacterium]